LLFANFAKFFAAFAVKSSKALNRKARKGIAKGAKKINYTTS
jgi:hypothetical protein